MTRVRVLVVDDSATMREIIASRLRADAGIEVVGGAADPLEAREAIKALAPDVITLDVEMPKMNGLEFLEKIMRLRPMPVVMVSTLTSAGAAASIAALELGAFECVPKSDFSALVEIVKAASRARVRPLGERTAPAPSARRGAFDPGDSLIAIGSSTGGVEALITMLSDFPANCPPTLVTQHMPATFTSSFAARLDRLGAPRVAEATDGAPLEPGRIYLAPGGATHLEIRGGSRAVCRLRASELVNGHRPSVDVLFESVAREYGARAVGVILTGMGKDGASGLLAMRRAGARTLGQDEATSVVYGMPKAAFELGAVERQMPITRLGAGALDLCAARAQRAV